MAERLHLQLRFPQRAAGVERHFEENIRWRPACLTSWFQHPDVQAGSSLWAKEKRTA
jgi:hypothetical protein